MKGRPRPPWGDFPCVSAVRFMSGLAALYRLITNFGERESVLSAAERGEPGDADDERLDDAMQKNLDAVSKLPRIDGIDESSIFTVSTSHLHQGRDRT